MYIDELFVFTETFKTFRKRGHSSFSVAFTYLPGIKQFHRHTDIQEPVSYFSFLKWSVKDKIEKSRT